MAYKNIDQYGVITYTRTPEEKEVADLKEQNKVLSSSVDDLTEMIIQLEERINKIDPPLGGSAS